MSFVQGSKLEDSRGAPFAFAVLGGALFTGLGTLVLFALEDGVYFDIRSVVLIGLFATVMAAVVIGIAAAVVGLPLTWLLTRLRLERPWAYPLAGAAAGAAIVTFLPVLTGDLRGGSVTEFLPYAWVGALPGCVCGIIWWMAYRRHMQDFGEQSG